MDSKQKILNLNKRRGETPLECIERFRLDHPDYKFTKMTYAGRLDPLASGVLIVLAGEDRFKKESFLRLNKEYEFDCLWGVNTDTYDPLGLVTKISATHPTENEIKKIIQSSIGKREQIYPLFSSKTIFGRPLFSIARKGNSEEHKIPTKEIEVFSTEIISSRIIKGKELLRSVKELIGLVNGDFRQEESISLWCDSLSPYLESEFLITKMRSVVSSGTYIRSLVNSMGEISNTGAIAYSILRTRVGDFGIISE